MTTLSLLGAGWASASPQPPILPVATEAGSEAPLDLANTTEVAGDRPQMKWFPSFGERGQGPADRATPAASHATSHSRLETAG